MLPYENATSGQRAFGRSRHLKSEHAPKTHRSTRLLTRIPNVIELIKSIRPLHVTDEDYVFVNSQGAPLDPQILAGKYWHPALSYCRIRQRKPYCMKHTYISL